MDKNSDPAKTDLNYILNDKLDLRGGCGIFKVELKGLYRSKQ